MQALPLLGNELSNSAVIEFIAARLWCGKSPQGRVFEDGLRHATTEKLSLSQLSSKQRIREG